MPNNTACRPFGKASVARTTSPRKAVDKVDTHAAAVSGRIVAQIFNLLCRRFGTCAGADCKSATQQTASLRYDFVNRLDKDIRNRS
jgi:hypothetical protein